MTPDQSINILYAFEQHSYEQLVAAGHTPPLFDSRYPQKTWADPGAHDNADADGNVQYTVLATKPDGTIAAGPDGLPYARTMTITADRAAAYNLFPSQYQGPNLKYTLQVPLDLTKKPAGYVLAWSTMIPGTAALHNTAPAATETVSFTESDHLLILSNHDLLTQIVAKLP